MADEDEALLISLCILPTLQKVTKSH